MTITFEYVGQGDCIILEWEDSEGRHLGVVDCNRTGAPNPVIRRLESDEYDALNFVILSHPHADHFSGLADVFRHCLNRRIPIGLFGYTTDRVQEYVRSLDNSFRGKQDLVSLFWTMKTLEDNRLLERRGLLTDQTRPIPVGDLRLHIHAPSAVERDEFGKSLFDEKGEIRDKPKANWLSTILELHSDTWRAVFTSDAEVGAQRRVSTLMEKEARSLVVGQVSHHGAEGNFHREFWEDWARADDVPTAISVGPNPYGHPDASVIEELTSLGYSVETTWTPEQVATSPTRRPLDLISTASSPPKESPQSLVYVIDEQTGEVHSDH